jgi:hypothetical protein
MTWVKLMDGINNKSQFHAFCLNARNFSDKLSLDILTDSQLLLGKKRNSVA